MHFLTMHACSHVLRAATAALLLPPTQQVQRDALQRSRSHASMPHQQASIKDAAGMRMYAAAGMIQGQQQIRTEPQSPVHPAKQQQGVPQRRATAAAISVAPLPSANEDPAKTSNQTANIAQPMPRSLSPCWHSSSSGPLQ
jgi:hypothetical protein